MKKKSCAFCGQPSDSDDVYCNSQCSFLAEQAGYSEDGLLPDERILRDGLQADLYDVARYVSCDQKLVPDLLLFFEELEVRTVGDLQQTAPNKIESTVMVQANPEILDWVSNTLCTFEKHSN